VWNGSLGWWAVLR